MCHEEWVGVHVGNWVPGTALDCEALRGVLWRTVGGRLFLVCRHHVLVWKLVMRIRVLAPHVDWLVPLQDFLFLLSFPIRSVITLVHGTLTQPSRVSLPPG